MSEYIYASSGEPLAHIDGEITLARKEIVRCRDCKYLIAHGTGCAYWDCCDIESVDGFCAWGERETVNKTGDFVTHDSRAERTCKMETDHAELEAIASSHEDTWAYKCSACDWSFRYDRGIKPNYCPNCGAKVVCE